MESIYVVLAFDPFSFAIWTVLSIGMSYAIYMLNKQDVKIDKPDPETFKVPETREGYKYTVVFGSCWVENPVCDWWGDMTVVPIIRYQEVKEWFNTKKIPYTIGYHYELGANFRICEGGADGVKQMRVGEAVVWPNPDDKTQLQADGATSVVIDEPEIFGGEEREGGIVGTVRFAYGDLSDMPNSYLQGQLGANISANRGFATAVLEHVRVGTSGYIKPWKFFVKRTDKLTNRQAQWYLAKANINGNLNAVHIVRECLTNEQWGMGYATSLFPAATWEAVADAAYAENFGLSMKWESQTQTLEEFVKDVLRHLRARVYQDLENGEILIKLVRDDYSVGSLEEFDEKDASATLTQSGIHEVPTTVRVVYWNSTDNKPASTSDDDIALMDQQGGKNIEMEVKYHGVTDGGLAGKLAARDRLETTAFPAKMKLKAKRTMAHLRPGDVFKYAYAPLDIDQVILRVITCDFGDLNDDHVRLNCMEDVFALQDSLFATPPASGWTDPRSAPTDVEHYELNEAPFWELVLDKGVDEATALAAGVDFLQAVARPPTSDAYAYDLMLRLSPSGSFAFNGEGLFTPCGRLSTGLPRNAQDATVTVADPYNLAGVVVGTYAVIDDEIVKVKSVNLSTNQVTVARGCLDTVPATHDGPDASGGAAMIWFHGTYNYVSGTQFNATDQPGVKFLTKTGRGTLAEGSATARNAAAFNSRKVRPYPPGDFKVNGSSYPASFSGQPTVSWVHRDRTQQTEEITEHSDAGIGPETSVTYTLTIYDEDNNQCRQVTGLTGTSYMYSEGDERTDCGLGSGDPLNSKLRFKLKSVRSGYDSWQEYDLWVNRV